jgi:hypothetical protein
VAERRRWGVVGASAAARRRGLAAGVGRR